MQDLDQKKQAGPANQVEQIIADEDCNQSDDDDDFLPLNESK